MDSFKKEHCLKMYDKLSKKFGVPNHDIHLNDFDNYFN